MKNVILIHGYNGIPPIFTYFKEQLEKRNYNVVIPEFPVRTDINVEKYFEVFDIYKEYFNEKTIVIAHSIGNPMFIKYISQNNLNISTYISLAGFVKPFYKEGKDDLNKVISLINISEEEKEKTIELIKNKYSIYSDNDHIVPLDLLKAFCKDIDSNDIFIKNAGHMGRKSGLQELPKVIEIIDNILD